MDPKTKFRLFLMGIIIVFILGVAEQYNQRRFYNMSPGLGIKDLHTQGINGKGINIALIDKKLLTDHQEYAERIVFYREIDGMENEPYSMQGPAVSSIIAGRNCGVAPRANLFYWAVFVSQTELPGIRYASAIREVIQFNTKQSPEEQIRILSISKRFFPEQGSDEFQKAVREAQNSGILVLTSSYPNYPEPPIAIYNAALKDGGYRGEINDYTHRGEELGEVGERDKEPGYYSVWVPAEPRLLASGEGTGRYEMYSTAGDGWGTPFFAGVAALLLQANPDLTNEKVVEIIAQTVTENENGLLMISPNRAVEKAKELL